MSIKTGNFERSNRINVSEDYQQIFRKSWCSKDEKFLVFAKRNGRQQARLGLSIPKKNISKACNRNKLKRVVRENFRYHKNILRGLDVVVVAYKKQTVVNHKAITKSINTHWETILECKKN